MLSETQIRELPFWQGEVQLEPLKGGITNVNYLASDGGKKYVVRLGHDILEHHVMRFNELAASRAAHLAGLSPAVVYASDGVTVLDYIESRTFTPEDVCDAGNLDKILDLIRSCHREVVPHLRGPALIFWVFHVIRDYGARLLDSDSAHKALVPELVAQGNRLEKMAGPFDIVYSHNDLLAANILDDGKRLWLIDWDYAGFNSPLFDLGGLASNNGLSEDQENLMLERYFETPANDALMNRYLAMKSASLLRETLWSMVSEISSDLDFDFAAYSAENLERFRASLSTLSHS